MRLSAPVKQLSIAIVLLATTVLGAWATDFFAEGEKLFMANQPEQARVLLESANAQDPSKEITYLYLGIIYEQLGRRDDAVKILQRGLSVAQRYRAQMYFNIGNNFFAEGKNSLAEEMYSQAVSANSSYAPAYLNRANSRMNLESYAGAKDDYVLYLRLDPETQQRPQIEKVIGLLTDYLAEAERAKQEAEAKQQAEAERRKNLLNQVLNSLQNASEDATNLSSDNEDIQEYDQELEVDD